MIKSFKNIEELPVVLKIEDVAIALQVSKVTAYNLANAEGFPTLRIGKRLTVPKDAFIRWVKENTGKQIGA